ncbi:MAG: FmdB family zinc ribbon protein [Aeromonadaceae bacterium]
MPIYEYECRQCGHRLARLQKFTDAPLTECPACQQPALDKLLSVPGFRRKSDGGCEADFKIGTKKNLAPCDTGGSCQGCPASR